MSEEWKGYFPHKITLFFPERVRKVGSCPQLVGTALDIRRFCLFDQMNNFVPLYNDVKTGF